jgi:hypothetical protein
MHKFILAPLKKAICTIDALFKAMMKPKVSPAIIAGKNVRKNRFCPCLLVT